MLVVAESENDEKLCKQNLRLITSSSNFKANVRLIQRIIASSFTSTDALSCVETMVFSIDVAWVDWSFFDGTAVGVIKYPFMQLYYFIQFLYMQLSYMTDYGYGIQYAHGFACSLDSYALRLIL